MSFAKETEKLVQDLIQAGYKNACEKWGEKYNSLKEIVAILKKTTQNAMKELAQIGAVLMKIEKYFGRQGMMNYNEFLFKKDDEVICPSCKENGFVQEDISISKAKKLTMCRKCGAFSRLENWRKINSSGWKDDRISK